MSYDPAQDLWTVLSPMTNARAGLALAVVGNSIYAIGGRTNTGGPASGGALAVVERYDIATDTWTTVAPLLAPREDLAAAVVGNKIYVFGGVDINGQAVTDVDVYNPVTDTWSAAPTDLPSGRCAFYAVTMKGGTVYCIGGWDGVGNGLSLNESYKASQDLWTTGLMPMPTFRAETGAVSHGGTIFILGGGQPGFGMAVDANEAFKP
jgi:N-acetylneuraminic acid mutarotase